MEKKVSILGSQRAEQLNKNGKKGKYWPKLPNIEKIYKSSKTHHLLLTGEHFMFWQRVSSIYFVLLKVKTITDLSSPFNNPLWNKTLLISFSNMALTPLHHLNLRHPQFNFHIRLYPPLLEQKLSHYWMIIL